MIDPLKLQALVDGECDAAERKEIIQCCEREPSNWRRVGLAFLEEQVFSQLISTPKTMQHVLKDVPPGDCKETLLSFESEIRSQGESSKVDNFQVPSRLSQSPDKDLVLSSSWRPFIAASLAGLVLFSIGLISGSYIPSSNSIPSDATNLAAGQTNIDAGATSEVVKSDLPEISLPNANTRFRVGSDEIPLYNANQLDPSIALARQAYEMERIKKEWNAKGFDVEVKPRFISGELKDGRHWVIPVRELGITSNTL